MQLSPELKKKILDEINHEAKNQFLKLVNFPVLIVPVSDRDGNIFTISIDVSTIMDMDDMPF